MEKYFPEFNGMSTVVWSLTHFGDSLTANEARARILLK